MNYAKDFSTKKMMQDIEKKIQSYLSEEDKPVEPKGMLERKNSTNEIDGDSVVADSLADLITKASDNKAKRYRGMNFRAERPRSSPEEINEFLANMKEVNRIAPGFYYDKDDRNNPMNFSGSIVKEDRQTDALIDIAETALEQPVEIPTLDIAEAIEQDQVEQQDTSTLKGNEVGLMAKPSSAVVKDTFVDTFVTAMGKAETTTDHTDPLGIFTLGYGILPATAKANGFDPTETKYKDRSLLAKDVYGKMYQTAKTSYPDVFKGLTDSQKIGVMSLYINSGKLASGVVTALSKSTPDFDGAKNSLASVVLGSPRNTDGSRKKDKNNKTIYTSSKGLSKRRAKEYNILMKSQTNFKPVKTISVEGTKAKPIFVWKDKDSKEVHRYTPTISGKDKVYQGLDSSNSMKDVSL